VQKIKKPYFFSRKKYIRIKNFALGKNSTYFSHMLGNKQFELSNLPIAIGIGNVLTTVSDRKIPHTSDNITIDYYTSDITSAQDYYAFGQLMPGRNWSSNEYKFGFNGKENDNEVYGITGSFQDYGMRMYNALTGRFISSDPIIIKDRKYPELYQPY